MIARLMSPNFLGYGFGWFIEDLRGRRWVNHGGHIDGMAALVSVLPTERIGVVVLTNMNQVDMGVPLTKYLLDQALGIAPRDYAAEYRAAEETYAAQARAGRREAPRVAGTKPSLPPSAYAGTYRNVMMGAITVTVDAAGALALQYDAGPTIRGPLEHWHFDSFVANLRDPIFGKVPVTFRLGPNGRVISMLFAAAGGPLEWIKE